MGLRRKTYELTCESKQGETVNGSDMEREILYNIIKARMREGYLAWHAAVFMFSIGVALIALGCAADAIENVGTTVILNYFVAGIIAVILAIIVLLKYPYTSKAELEEMARRLDQLKKKEV
jgi:hypothetical protein